MWRQLNCKNIVKNSLREFSTESPRIGFIGLGQMGAHMAQNIVKSGSSVVVYDVNPKAIQQLEDAGAKAAKSPKEVAKNSEVIITMLPSSPHVLNVYEGENGVFEGMQPNSLLIDSSTIDPIVSKGLTENACSKGVRMVDAPVSGGITGAQGATLTFMVGGLKKTFQEATPILKKMGANIVYCGNAGNGQVAKICNNLALAIQMISIAEAMNLGTTLGVDPKVLSGIMNTSTSQCWSSSKYHPFPGIMDGIPSSNQYKGGFATKLMAKDLGLALGAGKAVQVPLPLSANAEQLYGMMISQGQGDKDFSSVIQLLAKKQNS